MGRSTPLIRTSTVLFRLPPVVQVRRLRSPLASVPADQYRFPADEPGYVNREPGLGTPLVDVADLATAPIGAATATGRAAAVAAEPFIAYGMDKAGNWLGDKVNGILGYFGWGE